MGQGAQELGRAPPGDSAPAVCWEGIWCLPQTDQEPCSSRQKVVGPGTAGTAVSLASSSSNATSETAGWLSPARGHRATHGPSLLAPQGPPGTPCCGGSRRTQLRSGVPISPLHEVSRGNGALFAMPPGPPREWVPQSLSPLPHPAEGHSNYSLRWRAPARSEAVIHNSFRTATRLVWETHMLSPFYRFGNRRRKAEPCHRVVSSRVGTCTPVAWLPGNMSPSS